MSGRDAAGSSAPASARHAFVYLASQSPRRRQLLDQIGVRHEPLLPSPEEDTEALEVRRPREAPLVYVRRVTLAKLAAAGERWRSRGLPAAPILCADTTVALGMRILGKPCDAADALATLRLLAGHTHRVLTAVAVGDSGSPIRPPAFAVSVSRVRFAAVADADLERYVAGGEAFGKAGAYAIQGAAAAWIEHIAGSHSGIMGLPLHETARLLRGAGVAF